MTWGTRVPEWNGQLHQRAKKESVLQSAMTWVIQSSTVPPPTLLLCIGTINGSLSIIPIAATTSPSSLYYSKTMEPIKPQKTGLGHITCMVAMRNPTLLLVCNAEGTCHIFKTTAASVSLLRTVNIPFNVSTITVCDNTNSTCPTIVLGTRDRRVHLFSLGSVNEIPTWKALHTWTLHAEVESIGWSATKHPEILRCGLHDGSFVKARNQNPMTIEKSKFTNTNNYDSSKTFVVTGIRNHERLLDLDATAEGHVVVYESEMILWEKTVPGPLVFIDKLFIDDDNGQGNKRHLLLTCSWSGHVQVLDLNGTDVLEFQVPGPVHAVSLDCQDVPKLAIITATNNFYTYLDLSDWIKRCLYSELSIFDSVQRLLKNDSIICEKLLSEDTMKQALCNTLSMP